MTQPLKVMIGFDQVESVAAHVLMHSILSRSSKPIAITPIFLGNLNGIYNRPRNSKQSNEFSFSRFLTPYLSDYEGWSLFLDCDMMLRGDVTELFEMADPEKAVMVVKHQYTPSTKTKYLGSIQYPYPRKNWSSVMLFNNQKCRILNPDYINTAPALDLHRFSWIEDNLIGELPVEWNHLVGEYPPNPEAKNVHWTIGGPYFNEYRDTEFASEWFYEYGQTVHCDQKDRS
jgi:hypothetical protein